MKIFAYVLLGWGILMTAFGIASLFLIISTPGSSIDSAFVVRLGIGIIAMFYGHRLTQRVKQSESGDQSEEEL